MGLHSRDSMRFAYKRASDLTLNLSFAETEDTKKGPSLSTKAFNMAGVERFELPTRGFGIRCSANWSYTPKIFQFLKSEKTSHKARSSE